MKPELRANLSSLASLVVPGFVFSCKQRSSKDRSLSNTLTSSEFSLTNRTVQQSCCTKTPENNFVALIIGPQRSCIPLDAHHLNLPTFTKCKIGYGDLQSKLFASLFKTNLGRSNNNFISVICEKWFLWCFFFVSCGRSYSPLRPEQFCVN